MSLVNLAHVCSHLQNCSKAHLALTSIPSTNLHLRLMLALQSSGFISTVTRAGPSPPALLTSTTIPSATDPAAADPTHPDTPIVTTANIASRRLWIGLKYWRDAPVLSRMRLESKPTRRVWIGADDVRRVVLGRESAFVKPLSVLGEALFLSTDQGVLEARECVERGVGGMVLVRVS